MFLNNITIKSVINIKYGPRLVSRRTRSDGFVNYADKNNIEILGIWVSNYFIKFPLNSSMQKLLLNCSIVFYIGCSTLTVV